MTASCAAEDFHFLIFAWQESQPAFLGVPASAWSPPRLDSKEAGVPAMSVLLL